MSPFDPCSPPERLRMTSLQGSATRKEGLVRSKAVATNAERCIHFPFPWRKQRKMKIATTSTFSISPPRFQTLGSLFSSRSQRQSVLKTITTRRCRERGERGRRRGRKRQGKMKSLSLCFSFFPFFRCCAHRPSLAFFGFAFLLARALLLSTKHFDVPAWPMWREMTSRMVA